MKNLIVKRTELCTSPEEKRGCQHGKLASKNASLFMTLTNPAIADDRAYSSQPALLANNPYSLGVPPKTQVDYLEADGIVRVPPQETEHHEGPSSPAAQVL